jgi:DNA polymerase III sliding clamp (beta) subunit (PCNA family)
MAKEKLTQDKAKNSPAGGVVVGKRNGQTMVYDDASVGGYFVGKTHKEGGIQMINKSTGQALEVQGSEIIITAPAVADQTKREFEGKMMTNREILSTINEKGGGVSFADGGDVPQSIKHTGASYKYGGKTMTDHEIMTSMNKGGHLAEGYSIREIADIHKVTLSDLKNQVRLGMKAESEHTSSKREQMQIVKDHLFENPKYYTLLKKAGLEDGGGIHKGSLVRDSKSGNTPARDLNNYNDVMDLQADNMVGAETGLFEDGGDVKPYDANMEGDSVDMMFAEGGAVNPIITNWNDVPSIWKNTSKVKKVAFTNSPYDKGLYSIVAPFLGKDNLRPIMSGINFDENGITVTNAHVLITLPYPSKEFEGVYEADLSKRASSDQITIDGNYPNYAPIIPKKEVTKPFLIDVYKLLQYNDVAMKFANKITNAVNYKIEDEVVGFNAKFLNESLKTLLKLGHDKAYAHYIAPNKALLLSPSKDYEIGNDELVLTMPVMVQYQSYGAEDLDYGRGLKVYYDFNDNEIHNADGSIAEFKMTYENNSIISKEDVTLLEKLANGKNRLAILDYVLIENGIARASDLETEYYLRGVDLPNGVYKPNKGALEITMEATEDYPRSPIFVTDEDTIQFVISSDILEYYIDKLKYVVGQDDLRPVMQGICLHHTSDNKLFLAGTDAHILLRVNITEYVDMPEVYKDIKFIIQPKRLYDFLNSTENTALTIKSNLVATIIESDNWSFYARNIDGNYPNYDAVMPKETNKLAVVNLEPIKKALNSEMVKKYIKEAYNKDKVFIFNKENEIFIATGTSGENIEKICDTNVDFSLKDYYNESQSVLLFMPFGYDKQTNFSFRKDLVERVAKIVNHNKLELHYTELNRAYLIPIDTFEFKTTTKEYKVKEQKPSIAEIKLVSAISEVAEINEAIETLEMLVETANRKDKKEIKEAIEVLQMLLDTYEY